MSQFAKNTAYTHITEGHPDDDDSTSLLKHTAYHLKRRASKLKRFLIGLVAIILAYAGGLFTEFKATPLHNRFGPHQANEAVNTTKLPKLASIGNIIIKGLQGTFLSGPSLKNVSNITGVGDQPEGFNLAAQTGRNDLSRPDSRPTTNPPTDARCKFEYRSHLGFDGSGPLGDLFRHDGSLDRRDVLQGALGDCGFIASISALISSGRHQGIKKVITLSTDKKLITVKYRFPIPSLLIQNRPVRSFKQDVVLIDDKLSKTTLSDDDLRTTRCWQYDAAYPGTDDSVAPSRPILYVPFLEKAWTKYVDADPDRLRNQAKDVKFLTGYPGIVGADPSIVLASFTGLDAGKIFRSSSNAGIDARIASLLTACITESRPCVIGTPNATTLDSIGGNVAETNRVFVNDGSGFVFATNMNQPVQFDIVQPGVSGTVHLVGTHAYAVDVENSDVVDGVTTTFENAFVTLINPWGKNLDQQGFDILPVNPSVRIKLETSARYVDQVFFC